MDPFDLERFVQAQEDVMAAVKRELAAGDKQTHWMWFVFPQLRALGRSGTAQRYVIASLAEARAYDGRNGSGSGVQSRDLSLTIIASTVPGAPGVRHGAAAGTVDR